MTVANKKDVLTRAELGFAGRLADSFIHSPLSPLLFIAMMLVGFYGLYATPRQEDPQISVPMIDIMLQMPGASSQEISRLVVSPLERLVSEIHGVKHVYSVSDEGMGIITLEFEVGEEIERAIVLTHNKVQANLDQMPPGAEIPLIKPKEVDDVPVVTLTLWSHSMDDANLRTLAVSLMHELKQVRLTGNAFVSGGRSEQVRIDVLPEQLKGYGITIGHIAKTIKSFNTEQTVGAVEQEGKFHWVKTGAFLQSAADFQRLVVGNHEGKPVYLSDVAEVIAGPEEARHQVTYYTGPAHQGEAVHGAQAVTIALAKQHGSNGVSVVNEILDKVEHLKGHLIPDNVNIEVTRNYGETANAKVNSLLFKLVIATAAVTFLVWISLGLRPAIVVLLTIPVVLVITVFMAMLMGYTIDRVSLFALIFSIGFLVDNAIVIVENIYARWLREGETSTRIAVDAVREVGNPTVLATYTVIAALLPMGFVRGMMGPYMEPIPALGSVAMIFSLIAAVVFAPWIAIRIIPPMETLKKMEARDEKIDHWLGKFYHNVLGKLLDSKVWGYGFLIGLFIAFFLTISMFTPLTNYMVKVKMLPFDNKDEFALVIDMPDGTALPNTINTTTEIVEVLRTIPEVTAIQTYVGTAKPFDFNGLVRHYYLRQFPWQAEVQLQLTGKGVRERSSHEIAQDVRQLLKPIGKAANAVITIVEMPPGPPVLQTVVAEVHGPDAETRSEVAKMLTELFHESELIDDVDNYMRADQEIWRFKVDLNKAANQGVSVETINQHLAMSMGMFKVGDVKQNLVYEPTYILLQVPLAARSQLEKLADLPVMTQDGRTIPLGELGQFVKDLRDPMIFHKDLRPIEFVVGDSVGALPAPIYAMNDIDNRLKDHPTPDGVIMTGTKMDAPKYDDVSGFEWTGEWTVTYETFRDMGMAFGVALVAIYMLVVWQFGNFSIPAVIMAPIPLTMLGILPGHWLLNAEFTATSMIGWIALAGIIVRNSILLIDATIALVAKGVNLREAVITATKARTRPIMITALALVLGSMVILTDPTFQGMAISLLFGVFVSTLLTLLVIPLGCVSLGERLFVCAASKSSNACDDYDQRMIDQRMSESDRRAEGRRHQESAITTATTTPVSATTEETEQVVVVEEVDAVTPARIETATEKTAPVVIKKKSVRKKSGKKKAASTKKAADDSSPKTSKEDNDK
ncbi:MAG: efflux RND transporter permease subunit [Gammaproteobacteria bacterium]|nr:efflux RND transporter permease subunit [Gammaproteobacteria bacterium]